MNNKNILRIKNQFQFLTVSLQDSEVHNCNPNRGLELYFVAIKRRKKFSLPSRKILIILQWLEIIEFETYCKNSLMILSIYFHKIHIILINYKQHYSQKMLKINETAFRILNLEIYFILNSQSNFKVLAFNEISL